MIVTNDDALAETLRVLRVHGSKPKYHHAMVGGNFRLDPLQAAVLRVKLPHLAEWTAARQAHAEAYRDSFSQAGLPEGALRLPAAPRAHHIYNQFVVRTPARDALQSDLKAAGIGWMLERKSFIGSRCRSLWSTPAFTALS